MLWFFKLLFSLQRFTLDKIVIRIIDNSVLCCGLDDVEVQRKVSKLRCIYCSVVVLHLIMKKIDLRCECISMASVECHIVETF